MSTPPLKHVVGLALASLARATCHYPDGTDVTLMGYVPCAGEIASCCIQHPDGQQDTCLSNGLCYSTMGNYVYQGACDDEWGSDRCPKYCLNEKTTSFERLFHCQENEYCCSEEDCCAKSDEVFDLGTPCVEEYLGIDNSTIRSNETIETSTTTASASATCTPWSLARQSSAPSPIPPTSDGGSMIRHVIVLTVIGCLVIAAIIGILIFTVRRWGVPTGRGGASNIDKSHGFRSALGNFGHRIMGYGGGGASFTPMPQQHNRLQLSTEKLRYLESTSESDRGSSSRSPSPNVEMEPMLRPEPAKVSQLA